jgi:hypothetical protein
MAARIRRQNALNTLRIPSLFIPLYSFVLLHSFRKTDAEKKTVKSFTAREM